MFRVIADVANLAKWNPTITASRQLSDGAVGNGTRFEMTPKGWFKLFGPMMGMMGRKNLRATAEALKAHVEGNS